MADDQYPEDPIAMMTGVLTLDPTGARTSEDIFVGRSHPMPTGRVYGGQVVAQCVAAALQTIDDQLPHSLHGYFLRPGDFTLPITFGVDRIHDGRSFARRRVQAYQNGTPIFSGIISFQREEDGLAHQVAMPDVPGPEELVGLAKRNDLRDRFRVLRANPIEAITVPPEALPHYPAQPPGRATWMRVKKRLPDNPDLHRITLAYMSDFTVQEPSLSANGVSWYDEGVKSASLDHAIWWHRFARTDEWLLYVSESASTQGGRGLNSGRLFTREGVLVASTAQEVMLRVPRQG